MRQVTWRMLCPTTLLAAIWACGVPTTPGDQYGILVVANSEEGDPLPGTHVRLGEHPLGETDASGKLTTQLTGIDGQRFPVQVTCPVGYDEPKHRHELVLQTFASLDAPNDGPLGGAQTQLDVTCHAQQRTTVVAVKADKPNIPVIYRGSILATTNASGVAHVQVTLPRKAQFRLKLDTELAPDLRPQNPTRIFETASDEKWAVWHQPLEAKPKPKKKKKKRRRRVVVKEPPPPKPHVPYRMNTARR